MFVLGAITAWDINAGSDYVKTCTASGEPLTTCTDLFFSLQHIKPSSKLPLKIWKDDSNTTLLHLQLESEEPNISMSLEAIVNGTGAPLFVDVDLSQYKVIPAKYNLWLDAWPQPLKLIVDPQETDWSNALVSSVRESQSQPAAGWATFISIGLMGGVIAMFAILMRKKEQRKDYEFEVLYQDDEVEHLNY
ncbi:hypothetical protein EDD86DRAFT_245304 [Gorgonomyces haynaldii]|nr:hypothetical protein EDD86DRAFT_245304 [Gorgonomyces haynaldii]